MALRRLILASPCLLLVLSMTSTCPTTAGEELSLQVDTSAGNVLVRRGDRKVLLYRVKGFPFKPYVKELRTPGGANVLLDSPEDHKHHHGMMFALGVNQVDFWGEHDRTVVGIQSPQGLQSAGAGRDKIFTHDLVWRGPGGEALLREKRTMRVLDVDPSEVTLLTFETALKAPEGGGGASLWGHHYFGLGLRFIREMDGKGSFLHPPGSRGAVFRGDERLTPGRWCAFQSRVDNRPVTVALLDHPLNPRYPTFFFTMMQPFAYMAATLNLHQQPREMRASETLLLRYGVALWDDHKDAEEVEALYLRWLSREDRMSHCANIALASRGTRAHASSEYGPDYLAVKAIDGRFLIREKDKWNSKAHITPHYLRLDFGKPVTFDTVVIRHEGCLPLPDACKYNTADYRIQRSAKPWGPWQDVAAPVRGNSDNVTFHSFDPVDSRYLRLLIETGEQGMANAYGRIAELEVYRTGEARPGRGDDD